MLETRVVESHEINHLVIIKEIIEKEGIQYLLPKESVSTQIWQYMFHQLTNGLEKGGFEKKENYFKLL